MDWFQIDLTPLPKFSSAGVCNALPGFCHIERKLEIPEIFIVEEGTLFLELNGKQVQADKGTVVFHQAPAHQRGYASSPGKTKFIWLHFIPAKLSAVKTLLNQSDDTLLLPFYGKPRHLQPLLELCHPLLNKQLKNPQEKALRLSLFLNQYYQAVRPQPLATPIGKDEQMVDEMKYWINKKIGQPIHVTEVAESIRKNPDYANRVFRKVMGISLSEFIIQKKMEQAMHLLEQGALIKEAAAGAGYHDTKHFANLFHKRQGLSPSSYRQSSGLIYKN